MDARSWVNSYCQKQNLVRQYTEFQKGKEFQFLLIIADKKWLGDIKSTKKGAEESAAQMAKKELDKKSDWDEKILAELMTLAHCTNKELITAVFEGRGYEKFTFQEFRSIGYKLIVLQASLNQQDNENFCIRLPGMKGLTEDTCLAFLGAISKYTSIQNGIDLTERVKWK